MERKELELVTALKWAKIIRDSPVLEYGGKTISTNAHTAIKVRDYILPSLEVNTGARDLLQGVIDGYII